jgi:hypothetical protein
LRRARDVEQLGGIETDLLTRGFVEQVAHARHAHGATDLRHGHAKGVGRTGLRHEGLERGERIGCTLWRLRRSTRKGLSGLRPLVDEVLLKLLRAQPRGYFSQTLCLFQWHQRL